MAQKLKCLDDDFEISGDYNSPQAKILKFKFTICDRSVEDHDCADEEEIRNWLNCSRHVLAKKKE